MDSELVQRAERLRLQATELVLKKCLAVSSDELDIPVLEAALRDASQLTGLDSELISSAQDALVIAQAARAGGLQEKPDLLKEHLFNAINDGDLVVARACLDANAETPIQLSIDVLDEDGNTPLSEAACYGELGLAQLFLLRGAHPDARNELGRTPIWRACYNGHYEVVKLLLESGADKEIPSNTGEEPGKHGSAETKALLAAWDVEDTKRVKAERCLGAWSPEKKRDLEKAAPTISPLRMLLQSGLEPTWPLKIGLQDLALAISAAHDFGKVALVVANGMEEAERYLLYSCEALVDCKQLLVDVFIKKRKTVEEAQQMLRDVLLSAMETHGVGLSLHIRMGDSACDVRQFCAHGVFPAEVFSGWNEEEVKLHFPGVSLQPDFQVVVSTRFTLEESKLHLADKLPFFEEMAVIEIDPESLS